MKLEESSFPHLRSLILRSREACKCYGKERDQVSWLQRASVCFWLLILLNIILTSHISSIKSKQDKAKRTNKNHEYQSIFYQEIHLCLTTSYHKSRYKIMCSKLFKINFQCIMCSNHYWFKFLWSVFYCAIMVSDLSRTQIQQRYRLDMKNPTHVQKKRRCAKDGGIGAFYCHPPTEHWFWQPLTDESIFVGSQKSSERVPAYF